jgi:carotenoid 1,2-hydratase
VFSPYYRWAQRRGRARADEHCALNVALYSPGAARWTMTERGARHVARTGSEFVIGPSRVHWRDDALEIEIDEIACPLPRRVRGRIRVLPQGLTDFVAALDARGAHRWGPIAPCARIEVALEQPALAWQGHAYLDSNEGDEPVTEAFVDWDWLRAPARDGSTVVVYDVRERGPGPEGRGGAERLIARRFAPDGRAYAFAPPPRRALPATGWRIRRQVRSEAPATLARTLEDTPFYARSLLNAQLLGEVLPAVHETLDLRRLAHPLVQAMLPVRMPRRG